MESRYIGDFFLTWFWLISPLVWDFSPGSNNVQYEFSIGDELETD